MIAVTANYIRVRLREPDKFDKESFKTINLGNGIKAIIGSRQGNNKTTIQSVLFDKEQYTKEKAIQWVRKNKTKFATALMVEQLKKGLFIHEFKEDINMSQEEKTESVITKFSDEATITALRSIIKKLEAAMSLDDVRSLIEELEGLLPVSESDVSETSNSDEGINEENIKTTPGGEVKNPQFNPIIDLEISNGKNQTTITVTEEGKTSIDKNAPGLSTTIIDQKLGSQPFAGAKMSDDIIETIPVSTFKAVEGQLTNVTTQLSEVLELNEKLITALKETESEMHVLKTMNSKLVEDKNQSEQTVSVFKAKVAEYENRRYQEKLVNIHAKWCTTFKLVSKERQDEAFKMLSNFQSEDKLEEMSVYIESLQNFKEVEQPLIMTQHTSTFRDVVVEKPDISKMSPEEKIGYLHQQYINASR